MPKVITIEPTRTIDSSLFASLQELKIDDLFDKDVTSVLPFLGKLLLSPYFVKRQQLLKLLYPIKRMNETLQLLTSPNIEPHEFVSVPPLTMFESASHSMRLRLVAVEYIRIQDQARQINFSQSSGSKLLQSDLFDNPIYFYDVAQCLCILLLKCPSIPVMNILDMSEALLYIRFGSAYVITLVANMPDRCQEVCQTLINFGERQDETANFIELSEQRTKTLGQLCTLNPSIAFTVRTMTLQVCKMPSLTILLTLDSLEEALERYNSSKIKHSTIEEDLGTSYDNAIAFITGLLLGCDDNIKSWFAQYTKSAQLKRIDQSHYSILSDLRTITLVYMDQIFSPLFQEETLIAMSKSKPKELNRLLIRATATLRLYCALRGIGSLKLNNEESETLLKLITCRPFVDQISVNFATTGVCTLLACPTVISNQRDERKAAEWLRWLIKDSNYSHSSYSSHGKSSISELLLLIAIHFQNNQNSRIAELICTTLEMKLQIKASVSKCKSLFVQEVFNDQMVAEHAIKVPVTKNLNNEIVEYLPVHCIHQLLESRSFSKHQVPIKDWVYQQICQSKRPLHSILPRLIEAYVNSVIVSASVHGPCGTNQPITEAEVAKVFKTRLYSKTSFDKSCSSNEVEENTRDHENSNASTNSETPMHVCSTTDSFTIADLEAAQVLVLYYLLLYEDVRLKKASDLSTMERASLINYSPELMLEIPVFYLLQLVRDNQNSFGVILPDLLRLVTSQYPQLCSTQHWLNLDHCQPIQIKTREIKESLHQQLISAYARLEFDPTTLAKIMLSVLNLPKEEIWPYITIFMNNLSRITRLKISDSLDYKQLIQTTTKLWWKFNTVFPRKLWVMTVNALRKPQNFRMAPEIKPLEYSWDELALDPLIVLRCDSRVFRNVDTLEIVLHILSAFLAASRRCLSNLQYQINEQPKQKDVRISNLEELKTTLILAQTSAAIQILLEFCLPNDEEQHLINKREDNPGSLDEEELLLLERFDSSVDCICEHLHQVFIADTNLAKLVHFQTYPSELLSTTSDKIPSMHICLDFIPELLSQPDITKQIFVIELTSHLCERYAITKSLNVAKLCFNVSYTLLQLLPSERRALFFIPTLPALLRICKVFPILREDAAIIINQINQITVAHMASTSSRLGLGSARPFEGIEALTWRDIKKMMGTLSLHEALYLCVQKASFDICESSSSPVLT